MDVIHVGAGSHDLNNLSDATGTTVADNHLMIRGMNGIDVHSSHVYNSHATASKVLTVTGDHVAVYGMYFSNIGQTDPSVTLLNVQGDYTSVLHSLFVQAPPAASGTGILFDNGSSKNLVSDVIITGIVDYGIQTNDTLQLKMINTDITNSGTGFYVAGASDRSIQVSDCNIDDNTLGVKLDNTTGEHTVFKDVSLVHNTTPIDDDCAYGESEWVNTFVGGVHDQVYPTTDGVSCDTGDGTWTWTANPTTIIPAATLTEPFILTGINIQSHNAAQIYKVELFAGAVTATNSLGIYEFLLGDTGDKKAAPFYIQSAIAVPANSIVGAKVMSSTDGVDNVTLTLSYRQL
jgi:hypothetical protein